jgi:hypothetical protein
LTPWEAALADLAAYGAADDVSDSEQEGRLKGRVIYCTILLQSHFIVTCM